jgi:hypothetical protein
LTVRAADGDVIRTLPPHPGHEQVSAVVAWSPDGRRVAAVVDEDVVVLDGDTGAPVATIGVPGIDADSLSAQAFSPDGSALVVLADGQLRTIDIATGTSTVLDSLPEDRWNAPVWSASGLIAVTGRHRVHLVASPSIEIPIGGWVYPARWSPDGSSLTYSEWLSSRPCADSDAALTTVAAGSPARHLLVLAGWIDAWAWSPDGEGVAVQFRRAVEHRGKRHPWPRRIPRRYEMFTRAGDAAVRAVVVRVAVGLRHGAGRARSIERLRAGLDRIGRRHPEVDDSAVQEAVATAIEPWLRAAGFEGIDALDELDC